MAIRPGPQDPAAGRSPTRRRALLAAAAALAIGTAAAVLGDVWLRGSPAPSGQIADGDEPTTDAHPTPSDPPTPGWTPARTAPPADTPALPADAPALHGRAVAGDPPGDVVDSEGHPPPQPAPAADLVRVTLTGDGDALIIAFGLAGEVPHEHADLLWAVDLWVDDERAATVTVQQAGTRRVAGVFDWRSAEQQALPDQVEVADAQVRVRVPARLLPQITGPFRWTALGQVHGGFEDRAPDEDLAAFPDDG